MDFVLSEINEFCRRTPTRPGSHTSRSGVGFPGAKRTANLDRLADVFSQAVERTSGSGVKLILESVNTRVDHPGALLDRTADAVTVARAVNSSSFGILYDLYPA